MTALLKMGYLPVDFFEKMSIPRVLPENFEVRNKFINEFLNRTQSNINISIPDEFYKLSEEAYEKFKAIVNIKGIKSNLDITEIIKIAELPEALFERAKSLFFIAERKLNQFSIPEIIKFTNLDEKAYGRAKSLLYIAERGENQLSCGNICNLSDFEDEIFNRIKPLLYVKERGNNQFSNEDFRQLGLITNFPKDISIKLLERMKRYAFIKKLGENQLSFDEVISYSLFGFKRFIKEITMHNSHGMETNFSIIKSAIEVIEEMLQKNRLPEYNEILQENLAVLRKNIDSAISPIRVSKAANINFWKNFLVTADKNNEKVIKSLGFVAEKYGKTGIPLQYSRADFIKDLNSYLEKLSPNERNNILSKLEITLTPDEKGYDGFINFNTLNPQNPQESKIRELCKKFLLRNKVITGNPEIDKFLNSIIKGMPEFVNVIGKVQHQMHQYTLDCHTLKVLQEIISNPKFEELTQTDKMVVQLMTLFHDIGKLERVIDKDHEKKSAIIASDILEKIQLPVFLKKRIVELIKNHNWLEMINAGKISPEQAAIIFRNPQDLKIAEIFASADLKGVAPFLFERFAGNINEQIPKIQEALEKFYQSGNMIFPTRILNSSRIPTVFHKGHAYRVIDIANLPDDFDLTKAGLSIKDKKSLRFLVHAPGKISNWRTMDSLTKPFNESVICTTLVTPSQTRLFQFYNSGLIMETPQLGVINSFCKNQGSGNEKNIQTFTDMVFKVPNEKSNLVEIFKTGRKSPDNTHRFHQREVFMHYLMKRYNLSESDYAQIYKQLADKSFLSQINDIVLSGGRIIKKGHIIAAYREIEKYILQNSNKIHNEINLYNPIDKGVLFMGKSIKDIPEEILTYARERNLPIILM